MLSLPFPGRRQLPLLALLAVTSGLGCADAMQPSAPAHASAPGAAARTAPVVTPSGARFAVDMAVRSDHENGDGVSTGDRDHTVLSGINRTLHIERSLAADGGWITSVAVAASPPGIRQLAEQPGRPSRTSGVASEAGTLGRLVFHESSGATNAYDLAGAEISLDEAVGSGSPLRAPAGTPYGVGSFLTHLVTDGSQAASGRAALRRLFVELPGATAGLDSYRREVPGGEMELLLDSKPGLVKEVTVRREGEVMARTIHSYQATGDGRYVRWRSKLSQRSASGALRSYVITFSNVVVDGVRITGGGAP